MKTILTKLSDQKAQNELKKFSIIAAILSGISLIVLWPLGVMGLAFGGRSLLLTWHKGNQGNSKRMVYRLLSIFAVVAGIISVVYGNTQV